MNHEDQRRLNHGGHGAHGVEFSRRSPCSPWFIVLLFSVSVTVSAGAQSPKISTLFPIGGKAGSTVEVEVRGSSLSGADKLIVSGPGVSGTVQPGGAKVDEKFKSLFQSKCSSCHELRSPANRSMTPAQWAATVDRMVRVRNAPLSAAEAASVTQYLQGMARAGRVTALVQIAQDAQPGLVEIRVGTPRGVSTACLFEIGQLPEVMGQNGARESAQAIKLPCVANGTLAVNAERHYYRFEAQKGRRLVFNLKGFRYDERTQLFFNPNLRLYDAKGAEIAESHGYYDLDPLIDWTCPADGDYTLEVRDLLGRGNPGSVYRLLMGPAPYDTVMYPPAIQQKKKASVAIEGKNLPGPSPARCNVDEQSELGIAKVNTPAGPQSIYVTAYPVVTEEAAGKSPVKLPAGLCGRIAAAGEEDSFALLGTGDTYEFELAGPLLGSPTAPSAQILNAKGAAIARVRGEGRMTAKLEAGQTYTLRVQNTNGLGGPEYVYFVEARPVRPGIACAARPDAITVKPGMTTAVEIEVTRREGVEGDIRVTAEDLPAGVTAAPTVIQPDRQSGWILLTAAPNAATCDRPIRFVVTARGQSGETTVRAVPQETYLMNNSPRYMNRVECVLAVRGEPDFTAELASPGPLKVHPAKAVPVKVRIKRREGFQGPVTVRISGLPNGWTAGPETAGPGKTEVTLQVRPDGGNKNGFLNRDPRFTPITVVVEAIVDEYPFVAGTAVVQKADKIEEEKDNRR